MESQQGNSLSRRNKLYSRISDNLSEKQVKSLRAMLTTDHHIPNGKIEQKTPHEMFNMLEDDHKMGKGNLGLLKELLEALGKKQLAKEAEDLEMDERMAMSKTSKRKAPEEASSSQEPKMSRDDEDSDNSDSSAESGIGCSASASPPQDTGTLDYESGGNLMTSAEGTTFETVGDVRKRIDHLKPQIATLDPNNISEKEAKACQELSRSVNILKEQSKGELKMDITLHDTEVQNGFQEKCETRMLHQEIGKEVKQIMQSSHDVDNVEPDINVEFTSNTGRRATIKATAPNVQLADSCKLDKDSAVRQLFKYLVANRQGLRPIFRYLNSIDVQVVDVSYGSIDFICLCLTPESEVRLQEEYDGKNLQAQVQGVISSLAILTEFGIGSISLAVDLKFLDEVPKVTGSMVQNYMFGGPDCENLNDTVNASIPGTDHASTMEHQDGTGTGVALSIQEKQYEEAANDPDSIPVLDIGWPRLTAIKEKLRLLPDLGMTEDETEDEDEDEEAREELKRRIRDIQATAAARRRRAGQAAENLRGILDLHKSKRKRLAELCDNIAAYLYSLDKSTKDNLKTQFDRDAGDILTDVRTQLHKEEYPILVAGETSSGKSTFLNLLLGDNILPVAHLSSTSTICEVKYGETRQAVVHLRKSGIRTPKLVTLNTVDGREVSYIHLEGASGDSLPPAERVEIGNSLRQRPFMITIPLDGTEERQEQLTSYMHLGGASRDSLPLVEKIEVFWPLPLLKGGIVLVDSPGVGEDDTMDNIVAECIPKAFAFLYIIDSSRAGGVQQDRLGQLLKLYADQNNAEDFNPESAMFICNKVDLVPAKPPEEQEELKSDTLRKLLEMWHGLKASQVFFVSTKKAVGLGGILSEDFTKVLDGLDSLLSKSLENKLETQYRQLTRLLRAALININVQLNSARQKLDKEAKTKKYQEVKKYLQSFQDKATQGIEELKSMLGNNIQSTKDFLANQVKNGNLKKDLMAVIKLPGIVFWVIPSERKVRHQGVLAKLVHERKGQDFSRLQDLFEAQGETLAHCPSFENFITLQERSFKGELNRVVKSIENAQQRAMAFITGSSYSAPHMDVTHDALFQAPLRDTFFRGVTLHWPGRSNVAHSPEWEASSTTESILQSYWDQANVDTPLVDILIQALSSSEELLTELVKRQVQTQHGLLCKMGDGIKKLQGIMDQTIEETLKTERSNDEILHNYEPQGSKVNDFLGQLSMFHLTEMRKYEYDLDSIAGWRDTRNRLGAGSFGEVYRVQVPWKGAETQEAALKLEVDPFHFHFLEQEEILRNLKGEHIVEYYGTAHRREGSGLRLGLVMELCEGTLESRIIGNSNPAWWGSDPEKQAAAFSYTQNLAVQLCEGLKTIHDAGYIHRDLKLINILVTKENVVKLADVGQTKREVDITGTPAGSPLYAAPEVKEQKVYNKSADIYSLGLILWEMWYGRTLYEMEETDYVKEMEKYLDEGKDIRMPTWKGTVPPTPEWTSLIHDCLKKDPKERPKIQECLDRISAMQTPSSRATDLSAQSTSKSSIKLLELLLLELQEEVTDIVRANFPNLNFVPDTNKEADEKRIELNMRTLQLEGFSSEVDFSVDAVVLDLIQERKKSVCRINWPGGTGTGFLLSKGKVLTCYHVYETLWSFHEASQYTATFFVSNGREYKVPFETPATFCVCHSEDLDYAILQLAVGDEERNLEGLPLLGHFISEREVSRKMVVLVGHPSGGDKKIDVGCIAGVAQRYIIHIRFPNLIPEDERKPLYDTSVMFHGSSGSPGFDTYGNVVLMHTRGFFPDRSSKSIIECGVRLSVIRDHARETLASEVFNEIFPATFERVTPMQTS